MKIASIIAAGIGVLCLAYGLWWQCAVWNVIAAVPNLAVKVNAWPFWCSLCAGIGFLVMACLGFLFRRKNPESASVQK